MHKNVQNTKIAVVGLGYVGLPLAVAFSEHLPTIGFDVNLDKINLYKQGIDPTEEIGNEGVRKCTVDFTADEQRLREVDFIVVAVPTPINSDYTPDLRPVEQASALVGKNLRPGAIVVFESTVWPEVTEEICAPILEKNSGLKCGNDFKIAYSPERINPGDKVHRLANIKKIVSGMDEETLDRVSDIYSLIIQAGVYRVSSIKVAEATKLAENAQRDVNIAFMNELAVAFNKMNIRTQDVIDAMNTKWNALGFTPGLVGGHCIGVDPYYFIYKAELLGCHSKIITAGRMINNSMGKFVADNIIKQLILAGKDVRCAKIYLLGITFKENCPDIRNSRVVDILKSLEEYGIKALVVDPWADKETVWQEYGLRLLDMQEISEADCLVACVAHNEFVVLGIDEINKMYKQGEKKLFVDVKSIFKPELFAGKEYCYWSL